MENNKLSIYSDVLVFPCDILNLQEKMDLLITASKLCGYDIDFDNPGYVYPNYLRINFSKKNLLTFRIDFDYDKENEYMRKINFLYNSNIIKLNGGRIFANEINKLIEELDRLIEVL